MAKKTTTEEKKPTKAQIHAMERAKCRQFIARAYSAVMVKVADMTANSTKNMRVNVSHSGVNRYIKLSIYGRTITVLIYLDGNVEIELTEFCHSPHKEKIFSYDPDEMKQEEFLQWLRDMLTWLIPQFVDEVNMDFHSYMDYVRDEKSFVDSYLEMMEDIHRYEDEERKQKEVEEDAARHC